MSSTAGWFPDPENPGMQRYFDGMNWSEHRAPPTLPQALPNSLGGDRTASQGNGLSIGAMVCGGIALLFFPIILGPIGIILGAVALSRKEPWGGIGLAVAGVGMVAGMVLGIIMWSSMS